MSQKTIVRCALNKYKTPLFSFDETGVYIRCKDCRGMDKDGNYRRGTFHLVPWSLIDSYRQKSTSKVDGNFVLDAGGLLALTEEHGSDGTETTSEVSTEKETTPESGQDVAIVQRPEGVPQGSA